jgi:outer membrane protein OmpA-like peptidoglycan-associated protein
MKVFFTALCFTLLVSASSVFAQLNVGREYGNPRMPFVISHVPEKHRNMLSRGNSPHHNIFTKLVCFKWACRNTAKRNKSLRIISYAKFTKKIKKNAKKGMYKNLKRDSVPVRKPVIKKPQEQIAKVDTVKEKVSESKVAEPVLKSDSLIVLNEFLFETNSSSLKADQFKALDAIMDFLIDHPSLVVKISGHTDNTGKESHNVTLSKNRAEVIAEYLIGNGVDIDRVSFQGLGSSKPLAPNNTVAGRSKNRRVELLIHDMR